MSRINFNASAMATNANLRKLDRNLNTSLERLSSGMRINRAADDVAGLSVSEQLRTQVRGLSTSSRNIQDGIGLINTAEGALNEVSTMLQRMRELAVMSANGTTGESERRYIEDEVLHLKTEIDRIADVTHFNGQKLLNGDAPWGDGGGVIQIGPNSQPHVDHIRYEISAMHTDVLGIDGDNLSLLTQESASEGISTIDLALQRVTGVRSDLGAITNRLEFALTNQLSQEQNMQSAESVIRDADIAYETTVLTRNQILQQSSMAMLAQANTLPSSILDLLK